ncbi:MAG: DUF4129 domain-containing protein, partial [Ardenticatenaceae bacterium]
MNRSQLRYTSLQLSTLGIEVLWLSAVSYVLAQSESGGALSWMTLFVAGGVLLFFYYWLWMRDIWDSGVGRVLSASAAILVISGLMQVAAPEEVGWVAGPGDWIRAIGGLSDFLAGPVPLTVSLLVGLLLLYRVMLMVRLPLGVWEVASRLRLGGGFLVVAMIIGGIQGVTFSSSVIVLFFAFALMALGLARAKELSNVSQIGNLPFSGDWIRNLVGAVGGVLFLGGLLAYLIPWHGVSFVTYLFAPLVIAIVWLFALFAQLVAYLLTPALKFFWENVPLPAPSQEPNEITRAELEELMTSSGMFDRVVAFILLIVAIMVLLYILNRLFTRRRKARQSFSAPETEYSEVTEGLSISQWLRRQAAALRNLLAGAPRRNFGIETVRDLYKNLLLFGDEHRVPRPIENTPYEYLEPLYEHYPQLKDDFYALTNAYVSVHYGERNFSEKQIERLQAAWQRIA